MRTHEVEWTERRKASEEAKRALVERLKPKPAVRAAEVIPFAERTRVQRPRKVRRTYEREEIVVEFAPEVVVVETREVCRAEPIRYSAISDPVEFEAIPVGPAPSIRRKGASKAWRQRQWMEGNRNCTYCDIRMTMPTRSEKKRLQGQPIPSTTATVDHKHPLGLGGDDAPWNWAMACSGCNNRKGSMTEEEFRALIAIAAG